MFIILAEWRNSTKQRQIKVMYRDGRPLMLSTEEAAIAEANELGKNTKTKYTVIPYTPKLAGGI